MSAMSQYLLTLQSLLLLLLLTPASLSRSSMQHSVAPTCQSIECVTLAAEIANRMNATADPCRDFYNFACGNFPNVVKYNPLKAVSMPGFDDDFLLEDTLGLMTERLEKNIYELLVLDRVATSKDADMSDLYNFTRVFYRSCRQWIRKRDDSSSDFWLSAEFLRGVYSHLNHTVRETSGGVTTIESILAALVKAGGRGFLAIDLPWSFSENVLLNDDLNLTKTARARVWVDTQYFSYGRRPDLNGTVGFLADAEIGAPELNFTKKAGVYRKTIVKLLSALSSRWQADNFTVNVTKKAFTVAELDALAAYARPKDPFSWTLFFEELLQAPIDPAVLIDVRDPVELTNFVTFFKSRRILASETATPGQFSDEVSFLIFDWLLSFAAFFPVELQETWLIRDKTLVIQTPKGEGVIVCMMWTKRLLQPLVERMYQKAYHREDFNDIKQLVQLIKDVSIESVRRQPWMTLSAKAAIVKKIQSVKQTIGLDDLTASQLKSFYSHTLEEFREVKLLPGKLEKGFGSLMSLALCAYARKNFDIMSGGSPVTLFLEISPLVVNAFNWIQKNQIIFPMAILAPPVYHPSYPEYINLGSLGYIIGHEIGHSFDNMGHTINQMGAIGHFWDNVTEEKYLERMECIRSRYGGYRLYPGGQLHDSNSTLGNDIADIIGIKAAIGALKRLQRNRQGRPMPLLPNLQRSFSPEQLLFIQAAQGWCMKTEPEVLRQYFGSLPTHSPHHLRIRGIVENSAEFAEAFRCRPGNPMNPKNKCTFW